MCDNFVLVVQAVWYCMMPFDPPRVSFIVDHPFIVIHKQATDFEGNRMDNLLFFGAIYRPDYSM